MYTALDFNGTGLDPVMIQPYISNLFGLRSPAFHCRRMGGDILD